MLDELIDRMRYVADNPQKFAPDAPLHLLRDAADAFAEAAPLKEAAKPEPMGPAEALQRLRTAKASGHRYISIDDAIRLAESALTAEYADALKEQT